MSSISDSDMHRTPEAKSHAGTRRVDGEYKESKVLKTQNVTPMPDFEKMRTPELAAVRWNY